MKILNKLTPEIRKQLNGINETLPLTAYMNSRGMAIIRDGKSKTVNHMVNLRDQYQKHGFPGVQVYVKHIEEITK